MVARFEIVVGRIEALATDAVVNAARPSLKPTTGVDAALRMAAGAELTRHTDALTPIDEGDVVMTPSFALAARSIIHAAVPRWNEAGAEGAKVAALARCYMRSIELAQQNGMRTIGFPCLGIGKGGWPRGFACAIAVAACEQALENAPDIERVVFCCLKEDDARIYRAALAGD